MTFLNKQDIENAKKLYQMIIVLLIIFVVAPIFADFFSTIGERVEEQVNPSSTQPLRPSQVSKIFSYGLKIGVVLIMIFAFIKYAKAIVQENQPYGE